MALHFSRDTKVFIQTVNAAGSQLGLWEIPVLDGYSFSQAANASEVTLQEMTNATGTSRRSRKMFNDSMAPAEWSFTTYMRPFKTTATGATATKAGDTIGDTHAVEEILWAAFVGDAVYDTSAYTLTNITNGDNAAGMEVSFANSNKSALGTFNLFFKVGTSLFYKLSSCCVNEASIDFDIDGIASINWSGFGKEITDITSLTTTAAITEGRTSTDTGNFIRNRLTSLVIQANDVSLSDGVNARTTFEGDSDGDGTYNTVLTGGNITLSNNLTFLTPETLGIVNLPLEHVTGTRSAGGSFTCYLNSGTAGDSADLYDELISNRTVVTNSFKLDFAIGGSTGIPRVDIGFPAAHLEVPTTSIDDVLGLEFTFAGLATNLDSTDETTVKYIAPA